jgi:hypothetical protein
LPWGCLGVALGLPWGFRRTGVEIVHLEFYKTGFYCPAVVLLN